jgi:hypothetical protein
MNRVISRLFPDRSSRPFDQPTPLGRMAMHTVGCLVLSLLTTAGLAKTDPERAMPESARLLQGGISKGVPMVTMVRAGAHADRVRIVLEASAVPDLTATVGADGQELIVDLPGTVWTTTDTGQFGSGAGAKDWRVEPFGQGVRMTIRLTQPAGIVTTTVLPKQEGRIQRLILDIRRPVPEPGGLAPVQSAGIQRPPANATSDPITAAPSKRDPDEAAQLRTMIAARLAIPGLAKTVSHATTERRPLDIQLASLTAGHAVPGFFPARSGLSIELVSSNPDAQNPGPNRRGKPLSGSSSTTVLGNPVDMGWGIESGGFNFRLRADDAPYNFSSRLDFGQKSLTVGVEVPF